MKNEEKYTYIKHDVYDRVKRCNRETREYERYDYSQDEWVVDNDFDPFEDFFDYSNISEEEAMRIISGRRAKLKA